MMTTASRPGTALTLVCSLGAVLWLLSSTLPQTRVAAQADTSKLTTILADLVRQTAQSGTQASRAETAAARPFDFERLPKSAQDAVRGRKLRINSAGEVQVYILMQAVTEETVKELAGAGATIEIQDAAHRRVQARVPIPKLQAVAALPFVNFVRLPNYAVRHTGSVTTEGDAILHADAVRRDLSLDGTGVKVGVISDGIKGIFATGCTSCSGASGGPIASGDLPSASGTRNASGVLTSSSGGITGRSFQANSDLEGLPPVSPPCQFPGAGAEGTAILEIIHDLAPGAQLSFANADTDLAFMQAVNYLASTNDIVIDDLGFFGEAYDGTSPVSSNTAAALNNDANRIRTYVTSVGNSADEHYLGTYRDSGVDGPSISGITNGGHLHLFAQSGDTTDVLGLGAQPYNVVSIPAGGEAAIFLTWDDPFGSSSNDYDLYLVRQTTGAVVARSTDAQNGRGDPVEAIDYVNNTGSSDLFRIVVQNVGNRAAAKSLNLFSFEPECAASGPRPLAPPRHERHNYNTATRSVTAESDAGGSPVSVISVGAICSASAAASAVFAGSSVPDESCNDRNNQTIEFFSSIGPTIDGRLKPEITGIDGVSITAAGRFENPFFGTSAAAPHIAGIAALVLQSAPCLVSGASAAADPASARATLRDLLLRNADGIGDVPDNVFGYGRADAVASVQKTLPVLKGATTIAVAGNSPLGATLSPAQLGFSDPNQCGVSRLSWTGGCGTSPGATMSCPFGTSNVSVSASNNGVSFSPATNLQITVTNFGIGVSPGSATVDAGKSASYQVSVSSQGGAYSSPVTLGCTNLPTGANCSFNPATVSPGSGAAVSTLTITTTSSSSAASYWPPAAGSWRLAARCWPLAAAGWLVAAALAFAPGRRHRRLAAALPAVWLGALIACGGSSSSPPVNNPGGSSSSTAAVTLSPASLTFASQTVQTASVPQLVTLTSSGSSAVTISTLSTSGDFSQTNTCGSSVAAGGSCTIAVTFTPTAAGQRAGTLTIADNAANSPQSVSLAGTATSATGGTPAGTYQVSVTGVSGTLAQTGSVTLVVR